MVGIPVYVINLVRSKDRWEHMVRAFPSEHLFRVEAVDGSKWEAGGKFQGDGRPVWKKESLRSLKEIGILGSDKDLGIGCKDQLWPSVPGDVACAMSHLIAWKMIRSCPEGWSVVLEDDVQPTVALKDRCIHEVIDPPYDADIVFLHGNTPEHDFLTLDSANRVLSGYGMLGYLISKKGASISCEAMSPMYEPVDRQLWKRAFKRNTMVNEIPLPEMDRIEAYGLSEPLIEIADVGLSTTMLRGGGPKPWTKKNQ